MADPPREITRRDYETDFELPTGNRHEFSLRPFLAHVLEVDDVHFHHDSAVLLPVLEEEESAHRTADEHRVTGLAVLASAIRYANTPEHSQKRLLIAGHTDTTGRDAYNITLSNQRAENVYLAMLGRRDEWVASAQAKSKVEDYQHILKCVHRELGWDCDPGPVNNVKNARTNQAINNFQRRYNEEMELLNSEGTEGQLPPHAFAHSIQAPEPISVDYTVGEQTWGAFFDFYQYALKVLLEVDQAGLDSLRANLTFFDPARQTVGCGENFPISSLVYDSEGRPVGYQHRDEFRSQEDRRVEILFFDPDEEPQIHRCHPAGQQCVPSQCELYNPRMFETRQLPVTNVPHTSLDVLTVYLRLTWMDPERREHVFPQDFPVTVEFTATDSSAPLELTVQADGRLTFDVERRKRSFTLHFQLPESAYPEPPYIATAPEGGAASPSERLVGETEADQLAGERWRIFLVPRDFRLADLQNPVSLSAPRFQDGSFGDLDNTATTVGNSGSPVAVVMRPVWQYLKFVYFDRRQKSTLSILPITLEGFTTGPSGAAPPPDTRSNWRIASPHGCQCLPWIIQRPNPKPDRDILVQFRTAADTYIETREGGARNLVSGTPRNTAAPERLGYYDLPEIWKSRHHYGRLLAGGGGNQASRQAPFEELASTVTSAEQPLMLSLDDMVLTEPPPGFARVTLANPDRADGDRLAIFSNTFAGGTDLTDTGLYRADTDRPYFSSLPRETSARNHLRDYSYIAEYPDWTRLVIAQGNFFDAFDRRTPDSADGVVGARAAVRWVDATASGVGVATGSWLSRPGVSPGSGNRVFFTIQPFYEQRHNLYTTQSDTDSYGIGRYDIALLRCCDVQGANEIAVCLQYFRFYFNFDPTFNAAYNPNTSQPVGAALNAAQRRQWINEAIANLRRRWNGPDGAYNPGNMEAVPRNSGTMPLRVKVLVFCQHLEAPSGNVPNARCHYELGVFRHNDADKKIRAYMGSSDGIGALDRKDNRPDTTAGGWFTFAHETGHAFSLDDEYIEKSLSCSYYRSGFYSTAPGNPFAMDLNSMMRGNIEVRMRHLWHIAEWLRRNCLNNAGSQIDWQLSRGAFRYFIRHHSQARRSHVSWPVNPTAAWRNQANGGRGRFDAYLYELGRDRYSVGGIRSGKTFQALLVLLVKMRFRFPDKNDFDDIEGFLSGAHSGIIQRFRNNLGVQLRNADYQNVWVEISPRYLVDTYIDNADYRASLNLTGATEAARRTEYGNKVNDILSGEPEHFTIEVVDRVDVGRGVREWGPPGPSSRRLTYEFDDDHQFWELFAQMLGLPERETPSTGNFAGIAQLIGGQVVPL